MNIRLDADFESVIRVYLNISDGKGSLVSFVGALKSYNGDQIVLHPQELVLIGVLPVYNVTIDSDDSSDIVIQWCSVVAWEYESFSFFRRKYVGEFAHCDSSNITLAQFEKDSLRVVHDYNNNGFCKGNPKK